MVAIVCIASFVIGIVSALICVRMGLRWQIETKQGKAPTMELNPIKPIIQAHKADNARQEGKEILQEWMHGEG